MKIKKNLPSSRATVTLVGNVVAITVYYRRATWEKAYSFTSVDVRSAIQRCVRLKATLRDKELLILAGPNVPGYLEGDPVYSE